MQNHDLVSTGVVSLRQLEEGLQSGVLALSLHPVGEEETYADQPKNGEEPEDVHSAMTTRAYTSAFDSVCEECVISYKVLRVTSRRFHQNTIIMHKTHSVNLLFPIALCPKQTEKWNVPY